MHNKEYKCRCCCSEGMTAFHQLGNVPVQSVLNIKTRDEAVSLARGNIELGFCERCGFISNVAFDPGLLQYSVGYESTQSFYSTYSTFARNQAEQLICSNSKIVSLVI